MALDEVGDGGAARSSGVAVGLLVPLREGPEKNREI